MVATPEALVVLVAAAKLPLAFDFVQVTVNPDVAAELLLASASCAVIVTLAPAAGLLEDEVTKYFVAAPNVKLNDADVTAVSKVGVNVNVKSPAVPVIRKLVNVATPFTAATVVVPDNVPPVPEPIVATTLTVELVTVLPPESTILITG